MSSQSSNIASSSTSNITSPTNSSPSQTAASISTAAAVSKAKTKFLSKTKTSNPSTSNISVSTPTSLPANGSVLFDFHISVTNLSLDFKESKTIQQNLPTLISLHWDRGSKRYNK